MTDSIDRSGLPPRFWEQKRLEEMDPKEWEALCDGCGKCCLNKLEDEDTGVVVLTRVACKLFDDTSCRCSKYAKRHETVPACTVLTPENLPDNLYWMPDTCAYKRLHLGKSLEPWHPLLSGMADSVHAAGVSVQGITLSESDVPEATWEEHIID